MWLIGLGVEAGLEFPGVGYMNGVVVLLVLLDDAVATITVDLYVEVTVEVVKLLKVLTNVLLPEVTVLSAGQTVV